jgi:endoglucanase
VRDDGLIAWRWDSKTDPHVTDINPASDGDILIAYALDLAARAWGGPEHADAAVDLAQAIGAHLVIADEAGRPILLPGVVGFTAAERSDGPVVNLSYWVFEAFPTLARLDPRTDWQALGAEGLRLVETARFGASDLPPDWLSLRSNRPAEGFAAEYGYNALRLPLYLIRAGLGSRALLERLGLDPPAIVDLANGSTATLDDPGYRSIAALVACRLDGTPLPPTLTDFAPTDYYPSTLHLLVLAEARKAMPQCL